MSNSVIKGGIAAHIFRRLFHISMLIIPLLYYHLLIHLISEKILHLLILAFIFLVFLCEKLRVRYRLVMFGQRNYEAMRISAFAWTMLSIGILLLVSPSAAVSMPIVASCAVVDPLLGEMRLHHIHSKLTLIAGILFTLVIWLLCARIYDFPAWYAVIMAPITVASEWPSLKWIDDNALMILVPLAVVSLLLQL